MHKFFLALESFVGFIDSFLFFDSDSSISVLLNVSYFRTDPSFKSRSSGSQVLQEVGNSSKTLVTQYVIHNGEEKSLGET